jgi:hypothetical protein
MLIILSLRAQPHRSFKELNILPLCILKCKHINRWSLWRKIWLFLNKIRMIYKAKPLKNMLSRSLNNYSNKFSLKNHLTLNQKFSNLNQMLKKRNNNLNKLFLNKLLSKRLKFFRLYHSKKFRNNKIKRVLLLCWVILSLILQLKVIIREKSLQRKFLV